MSKTIELFRTSTIEAATCTCGDPGPIFLINSQWWHLQDEAIWPAGVRMVFDFRNCARCEPLYKTLPPPPQQSPVGASCDWGYCHQDASHWRWHADHSCYLPVCDDHLGSL